MAIIIAVLSLLGVVIMMCAERTKEIGIRKVNGARIMEILDMLNKDFVKWVVISFIIATPFAWYAMHKWLQNFAYKTRISWWIFALTGLLTIVNCSTDGKLAELESGDEESGGGLTVRIVIPTPNPR